MSDINNNININVQAQYESLNGLLSKLEEAKTMLGKMSKARINFNIKRDIQKSADPIARASQFFEASVKRLKIAQNDMIKAIVSNNIKAIEKARQELETAEKNARDTINTIEHTQIINTAKQDYSKYQAEELNKRFDIEEQINRDKSAMESLAAFERSLDPIKQKAYELGVALARARQQFLELNKSGKDTRPAEKSIKKLSKQMKDLEASTKKTSSSLKILLGRIKNIAIYRTIRTVLHSIMQTITTGIERVVELNQEAEQTTLRLKVDYNLIATAIGSIAYTIMNVFVDSIDTATDSLINLLNSFNKVLALALGSSKYFKVVRKGIDGINQSTKQLSFDKFEALNTGSQNTLGVDLEEVKLADDEVNNLTNSEKNLYSILVSIKDIFNSIWEVVSQIWTGIVLPILNSGILNFLVSLVSTIVLILDKTKLLSFAFILLIGVGIVKFIISAQKAFLSMNLTMRNLTNTISLFLAGFFVVNSILSKFSGVSKVVVSALLSIVSAGVALWTVIWAIKNAWNWVSLATVALAGGVLIASIKGIVDGANEISATGYENGGIPEKSELFYMNEYGKPEALVNTGGNQTNVINMTQLAQGMKQGFVEAIYETGLIDAMQNRIVIEGNNVNDNAFARAIFPALKTESKRRGGNQL